MKRSPLAILFVTLFIDLLGFGLVLPLIPLYITHFGGKPWVGGFLLASFSIMQFLFAPIWGRASDRYGRRPLILMSLLGSALAFFFFGYAQSLAVLFIARIAAGVLTAASLPTAQAYVADVTPPEKRASGMAVLGAAFGLGFALGPALGGYLSQHTILGFSPLAMPAYFAAMLSLINFTLALFLLPESLKKGDRVTEHSEKGILQVIPAIRNALRHPAIGSQLLVFAFASFAFTAVESSFSWLVILRFKEEALIVAQNAWSVANPGIAWAMAGAGAQQDFLEKAQAGIAGRIFAVVGITILFTQGAVMGGLARKIGENRLVMFGTLLLTFVLVGIALSPSLPLIYFFSALIAVGNGVLNPSLNALITQAAGPQERGMLSGVQQSLGSMARIIAPPINNTLVGINSAIPFLGSSLLMGTAFMLSIRLRPLDTTGFAVAGKSSPATASPENTETGPVAVPASEDTHV